MQTQRPATRHSRRRLVESGGVLAVLAAVVVSGRAGLAAAAAREVPDAANEGGTAAVWSTLAAIDRGVMRMTDAEANVTLLVTQSVAEGSGGTKLVLLYQYRAQVRERLGRLQDAYQDLSLALNASESVDVMQGDSVCERQSTPFSNKCVLAPSVGDLLLQRARLGMVVGGLKVLQTVADDLLRVIEEEDGMQPYAHLWRGDTLMRLANYPAAATDFAAATQQFGSISDGANSEAARVGWAFALFGQVGKEEEGVAMMRDVVVRVAGVNAEVELLVPLSEREAGVHVALAALAWSQVYTWCCSVLQGVVVCCSVLQGACVVAGIRMVL